MAGDSDLSLEWKTAGRSSKSMKESPSTQGGRERRKAATKQSARKQSPERSPRQGIKGKEITKGNAARLGSIDHGDGKVVFKQLENYLSNDAPAEYVWDTVVSLHQKAKERRFQAYWLRTMQMQQVQIPEKEARQSWTDTMPEVLRSSFEGLNSYWDRSDEEHVRRMKFLMRTWILDENCKQGDLETRLRCFTFVVVPASSTDNRPCADNEDATAASPQRSYLSAVEAASASTAEPRFKELQRLYDLCVAPMETLTTPRRSTPDEERALLLILTHELEVPYPPRFLVQTMTGAEMARFMDIFKDIEYPLYAHLMPGQRFGENMPKQALLNQIHMGAEAAATQKQAILDFKKDVSRLSLDVNSRVLTVFFKGKTTAEKWTGWQLPLAMKMLPLIDYEGQRESAKRTNATVALDYYQFMVVLRKGAISSTDMHWLFMKKLGLAVHTIAHTETKGVGMNDKQWIISIKAGACPIPLRRTSHVAISGVEILVYHNRVHTHWPCTKCGNPAHPEKYCKVEAEKLATTKEQYTWKVTGHLPKEVQMKGGMGRARRTPTTLEELRELLRSDPVTKIKPTHSPKAQFTPSMVRSSSEPEGNRAARGWTSLPKEWEQHVAPRTSVDNDHATPMNDHQAAQEIDMDMDDGEQATHDMDSSECMEIDHADDAELKPLPAAATSTTAYSSRGRSPTKRPIGEKLTKRMDRPHKRHIDENKQRRGHQVSASPDQRSGGTKESERHALLADIRRARKSASPLRRRTAYRLDKTDATSPIDKDAANHSTTMSAERGSRLKASRTPDRRHGSPPKGALQSYMHQFLQSSTEAVLDPESSTRPSTLLRDDTGTVHTQPPVIRAMVAMTDTHMDVDEGETFQQCEFVGARPSTDLGVDLTELLNLLGGDITDVAANGQCGWLAFQATLHNQRTGHIPLHAATVKAANELKKDVMNGIISNLRDEVKLHPSELRAELVGSANEEVILMPVEAQLQALATHYVEQRRRSVRIGATPELWVRTGHLKGMAMHAREEVYVMDVNADDRAHVQVYAYHDELLPSGELIETGSVTALETHAALSRLRALTSLGWCPLVMLLRWKETGNHFQAITYSDERYRQRMEDKIDSYAAIDEILVQHGALALDRVPYDANKTASAARKELAAITKAAKIEEHERPLSIYVDTGEKETESGTLATRSVDEEVARKGDGMADTLPEQPVSTEESNAVSTDAIPEGSQNKESVGDAGRGSPVPADNKQLHVGIQISSAQSMPGCQDKPSATDSAAADLYSSQAEGKHIPDDDDTSQ